MANPLTDADRDEIERVLAMIKEAEGDIARAKIANLDVSDLERQLAERKGQLLAIKRAYFPSPKG